MNIIIHQRRMKCKINRNIMIIIFSRYNFVFFSKSKKRVVLIQSNYNDYYQQSMQFRLSSKSKKKNVLYSFKKKIDVHHISKKNRRLNTMTNEKRYIFVSSNRHSNSYKENTRFVFRENRRLMIVNEMKSFKKNSGNVYFSSKSRRFQSVYEVNSKMPINDYVQQFMWYRSESDARTEQHVYKLSLKSFFESSSKSFLELFSSESTSYSNQSQFYQIKSIKLKSQKIMKFDFDVNSIAFFIKRFQFITQVKKKTAVLKILFMCLKNSTLKWHISLSEIIQTKMQKNLKIWKNELLKKYRSN